MAAFSKTEYRTRVANVSAEMQSRGIDILVVLAEANLCYLTGYEGFSDYVPQAAIVRAGNPDPILILREMDLHCAYPTVYLEEGQIDYYAESYIGTSAKSPWQVIAQKVTDLAKGGRIGVEFRANCYSFDDHQHFTAALGSHTPVDGSGIVEVSKSVKSAAEIAFMSQAATIVDQAFRLGVAEIAEGVRECDVAAVMAGNLIRGTDDFGGGPTKAITMGVGHRAPAPHLKWTDAPYEMNTQTDFEVGAHVHRYCCPLSRTVYLGEPPARLQYLHDSVLESFLAGFEAVRPGAQCGDIYRAFHKVFSTKGIRKESRIGYSLGIDWADGCFSIQGDDDKVLEVNNTFHLIIGVWEKQDAYVFSEALRVVEGGVESFSKTPRELFLR